MDITDVIGDVKVKAFRVAKRCESGDLRGIKERCDEAIQAYRTAQVYINSNITDRLEREKALMRCREYVSAMGKQLLFAYGQQGDVANALALYRALMEEFAHTAANKEVREAALASSHAGGFWEVIEHGKGFGVDQQSQGWWEYVACLCYGVVITSSCIVRQYEGSRRLHYRVGAAEQLEPAEAFPMFVRAYKTLGAMYEDEELEDTARSFSEIDDVWRLSAEVRKLAEKYDNKELRGQFLTAIGATLAEMILYYGRTSKRDEACAAYEDLTRLVEAHEGDND